MNVLEEMQVEQVRADVAARLQSAPEGIEERYRLARTGAITTGVLFAITVLFGQSWLGAFLPIGAAPLIVLRDINAMEIHAAEKILSGNKKQRATVSLSLYFLSALKYTLFFTPLDAIAWFFIALDYRMPGLAAIIQYLMIGGAMYFGLSRMRMYKHMFAALQEHHENFSE